MIALFPKSNPPSCLVFEKIAFDKSLSHRSVIFSFLCEGVCEVENFLSSKDTLATLEIAQKLGAKVSFVGEGGLLIEAPKKLNSHLILDCKNSGTSMRLYAGLLAGRGGEYELIGDESLSRRPMKRIVTPLCMLGGKVSGEYPPLRILPSENLMGCKYHSPIASAQVKGAFTLLALQASGESEFVEPSLSRDHSERFLQDLGAPIQKEGYSLRIGPLSYKLPKYKIKIPNDPSSVIFFVVAVLISKNISATFKNVMLNPTRIYAFEVLKQMGGKLSYEVKSSGIEEVGELSVSSSELRGVEVSENIAWLVDEIPALSIAMACAKGGSKIVNAEELRYKESDRIACIAKNLMRLGIEVEELQDGLVIQGGEFVSNEVESFGDHRIAMSFALVGVRVPVRLKGEECVDISFPHFFELLNYFVDKERVWK